MKIYNYLFYKSYLLARNSKNFEDMPALGGSIFVIACVMFNIFAILLFFEGLGLKISFSFKKEYEYIFSLFLVLMLLFYYQYKGRYKKIVEYYEEKMGHNKQLHPLIVIVLYYIVSFCLVLLAGMYRNNDGIFK
jgi:hypothetical protein